MGNILHLCQLIENVNCDEITRKLEVTKICPKSIPANLDSFKNAEAIALIFILIIHPKIKKCITNTFDFIPDEQHKKLCRRDVDTRNFWSERYK